MDIANIAAAQVQWDRSYVERNANSANFHYGMSNYEHILQQCKCRQRRNVNAMSRNIVNESGEGAVWC
jgi:hypothetical protein